MTGRLRAYLDSLGGRLLLRILAALVAVLAVYLFVTLKDNRDHLMEVTHDNAERTSQLIERATRYGMLLNRKEDVHESMRRISGTPGVAGIRLFDKSGVVIFSTDESEIGQQVEIGTEACFGCHASNGTATREVPEPRIREFRRSDGELALGLTRSIHNSPECSSSGCHAHPREQKVLGVLDVQMSLGGLEQSLAETGTRTAWLTLMLAAVLAGVCVLFIHRVVRRPILDIERRIDGIASGDLESRVRTEAKGELRSLARNFNRMTSDLKRARDELTRWSETLEERILEKTRELNQTQRQIVQVEKMVSLGRLSATVAHELNNPLSGILTYAKLIERTLSEGALSGDELEEVRRYLKLVQEESARCGNIVRNLLIFARDSSAELRSARLDQIVERSLMLVQHSIGLAEIQLVVEKMQGSDQLTCDANRVEQALVAILINAIESMSAGGTLSVRTLGTAETVSVVIGDTGLGMEPEVVSQVFEPFFSTKTEGVGVGLGMSVAYGIVRGHGGDIAVRSSPGRGTTVSIHLPRQPRPPQGKDEALERSTADPPVELQAGEQT